MLLERSVCPRDGSKSTEQVLQTFLPVGSSRGENICDPVLTHHHVTPTHGIREPLPGSLSVSLCNQSRRHCPKSRGVTFCCRAAFLRRRGRWTGLPDREIGAAATATFFILKKSLSQPRAACQRCPFMLSRS